jgi:hypothetical protein
MRTGLAVAWMSLVAALAGASNAYALYSTPKWDRAIVHAPLQWNSVFGNHVLEEAEIAAQSQGYTVFNWIQESVPGNGAATLNFLQYLQEPYGALAIFTHGTNLPGTVRDGLPMIEYFNDPTSAINTLRVADSLGLIDGPANEAFVYQIAMPVDSMGIQVTRTYYATTLDTLGLERLSQPMGAVIHAGLCDGGVQYPNWTTSGTGTMLGYGGFCPVDNGIADANVLWSRLHGLDGSRSRTVKEAIQGTTLVRYPATAGDSLVLAPWLIDVFPPQVTPLFEISGKDVAYAMFDTGMYATQSAADNTIRLGGNLRFSTTPYWEQDTTSTAYNYSMISYYLDPTAGGTGTVSILLSQVRSQGGIEGNSGVVRPSQQLVPRDTLVFLYKTRDVNIAVGIDRMTATDTGSGVSISFRTLWEQYADSFAVERLTGSGSVPLTIFPSSGSGGTASYDYFDPLGTSGARYQIVERQSGGRPNLTYEIFEAGPPPLTFPTEPETYDPDSLALEIDEIGNPGIPIQSGAYRDDM